MQALPEELIRVKAYEMWEAEGRPEGNDQDYWFRSARELETVETAKPVKRKRAISRKAKVS